MIGVGTARSIVLRVDRAREKLLRFALSLPESYEDHPWDETVAKVRRKVFVFFGGTPKLMTVKLVESHGHALSIDGAEPSGYGLGKAGWVNVPVDAPGLTDELLCDWIEESYRIVAPKRLVAELEASRT
jgi:predicted DNA-binding protein (MmcQ/YjbR family)